MVHYELSVNNSKNFKALFIKTPLRLQEKVFVHMLSSNGYATTTHKEILTRKREQASHKSGH